MTKPLDKSKLTKEQRTRKVLRQNRENPMHVMSSPIDKNPARYVRGGAVLLPKLEGAAVPANLNVWDRPTYRVGDGETRQVVRPGSQDAMTLPSRGFLT